MEVLIPFIVLTVLAIPIIIIVTMVSLVSKVRRASQQVDSLTQRLSRLEYDLHQLKDRAKAEETGQTAAPQPSPVEELWREQTSGVPGADISLTSPPPVGSQPAAELPVVEVPARPLVPPPITEPTLSVPPLVVPALQPAFAAAASLESSTSLAPPPLPAKPPLKINWEQFMGVKLFAWIGGLALFLGVAFFVKYSFERNLIPPEVRVAAGFLIGIGLLVGGVLMKRRELAVTSQTLCATGVVILYAVTFACRSVYHFTFFGQVPTFLLMVLITATAFALAVRLDAMVVAILGLVGGFLTPVLLSTGEDNPLGLFTYIALLDAGLIAVAFHRRWHFLLLLGAIGTVLMQLGWTSKFFTADKVFVALGVFLGFDLLFLAAFWMGTKLKQINPWLNGSAAGLPFVTLGFVFYLLSFATLGERPGLLFSFVLGADLCLLAMVLLHPALQEVHLAAGAVAFLTLAIWTGQYLTAPLLEWALGLCLFFAALHTVFPVVLARLRPEAARAWWGHLFPPVALLLILIPLFKQQTVSFLIWPAVLLVDLLAIGLALLTASMLSVLAVLVLTLILTAVWVLRIPAELAGLPPLLGVIGGFALFFFIVGLFVGKRILARQGALGTGILALDRQLASLFGEQSSSNQMLAHIPAFSAVLPFLLLIMVTVRLPLANPSPVFGLGMVLVVLLLGLALVCHLDALVPVSFACVLALEFVWHQHRFQPEAPTIPLAWYLAFYAVFTILPFAFRTRLAERILPWSVSALAGPLQFYLVYRAVSLGFPNGYLGLLPAALAVPMLLALVHLVRAVPADSPMRLSLLAWFGASALFFITLIFPIQFERQWLTIAWALEGVALIWLFHRVPHPGLRAAGVVLLAVAFARLALNPAVLDYHRNSAIRVFNWYLYAYGIVTVALMVGARLLAPPRNRVWNQNAPPWLYTLGTVLAFLLVNIEIADYFAEGSTLTFQFSGNFARDMSYSIAWALFALILLIVGIWKRLAAVRYAAMGLLLVTLLKLFLHDLSQLPQLYRIGAFMVVAVILIVASFLYQKFVSFDARNEQARV